MVARPDSTAQRRGGQCKNTGSLSLLDIVREVDKARTFPGGLAEFYIVTSADRDAKLQAAVRRYFISNSAPFVVEVLFWEDIVADIAAAPNVVAKHWKGFGGQAQSSEAESETDSTYEEDERVAEARHLYQVELVELFLERVSRDDFEQMLVRAGHGHMLQEVTEDTSYPALARYAVTRAMVGDWLRDVLRVAPADVSEDPRLNPPRGIVSRTSPIADHRRRRIAMLLQHMACLEGQQVITPGFLWIARGHENGHKVSVRDGDSSGDDGLLDYMGAIDLESVRDHLHNVLETALALISELDRDTVIAEEVPVAYMRLMHGLNARARILRHALRHGVPERASSDYHELIAQRDSAVELLICRLRENK